MRQIVWWLLFLGPAFLRVNSTLVDPFRSVSDAMHHLTQTVSDELLRSSLKGDMFWSWTKTWTTVRTTRDLFWPCRDCCCDAGVFVNDHYLFLRGYIGAAMIAMADGCCCPTGEKCCGLSRHEDWVNCFYDYENKKHRQRFLRMHNETFLSAWFFLLGEAEIKRRSCLGCRRTSCLLLDRPSVLLNTSWAYGVCAPFLR